MTIARRQLKSLPAVPTSYALALLILCFLFSTLTTDAKTPPEYRQNLRQAITLTEDFTYLDAETMPAQDYLKLERETLAEIRRRVPAKESIEWEGGTIETDNRWLAEKLDRFEREPRDSPKRFEILSEIIERLAALEQKVKELDNPNAEARAKDEDKRKLAEILQREEYQKPKEKQPGFIEKIIERIMKWFEEMFPHSDAPKSPTGDSNFSSLAFFLQMLLYAAILGAIGFIIYRFAPLFINQYRTKEKREKKERVILGERVAAHETAQNLFAEAERLASTGNLRGAIRKGYIAFLCELSDRKIIGLSQHKTNRDYLRDLSQKDTLYENMSSLTDNYERHWYGFETAAEKDWEEFKGRYKRAISN